MTQQSSRRKFLKDLALMASASALNSCGRRPNLGASVSGCPAIAGKRIRWIVPHESGGGYDALSRIIASQLGAALGSPIVVESRGGAGGLIGAQEIRAALPNGLTLGIIDASGLMAPILAGEAAVPNPASDFSVLCRVARSRHIWAAASDSPLKTMDDVLRLSLTRPVIFPINEVGSVSLIAATLTAHVLQTPIQLVAGYQGSRSGILSALRGEVDVVAYSLDSIFAQIKSGEFRPLLQISDEPLSNHKAFEGVPCFGGANGLAVSHARSVHANPEEAEADAHAIATLIGSGRLVVAPLGLDHDLSTCLTETLERVMESEAMRSLAKSADLTLDVADGESTIADLKGLLPELDKFMPVIQSEVESIRR